MNSLQDFKRRIPPAGRIKLFHRKLLLWFERNKRDYPWRKTRNPFRILVAEMMLQRTKADQVVGVYNKFFSELNSPQKIAHINLKKIGKILYPLGLKWRAKNFKSVCISLINNFNGEIPTDRRKLITLPGVGEYVAGMVLSTAFNKPEWVVDSNIVRLFKRYFGIVTTKEGRRDKHIVELAKLYVATGKPKEANLSLLDFAALVCAPRNPNCTHCPLFKTCRYFINKKLELKLNERNKQ